jgi:hypothetical protein
MHGLTIVRFTPAQPAIKLAPMKGRWLKSMKKLAAIGRHARRGLGFRIGERLQAPPVFLRDDLGLARKPERRRWQDYF